ncbi:hypothetical protein KIH75_05510 [Bifidobacterium sp. 64T4]|uniref:hypothetical protein n=1 Tax=Bifidobacterium pongonis TaxID=2834432 RepID=UPI001C591090|nr:hypothetical protein [Bifidobacterium pongonis]MBW3094802.1 hypothetical protein [Bifidobacterium pongonis]
MGKGSHDVRLIFRRMRNDVNFVDILVSCVGIIYAACSAWGLYGDSSGISMLVPWAPWALAVARVILYLALPCAPIAAAYAICVFNVIAFAAPIPGNGPEYIGTCYALALLAWRGSRRKACACLAVVLAGTVAVLLTKSDGYFPDPVSLLTVLAPYCVALLCGLVVREWQGLLLRQRLADREIAYRKEQLRMMHTLHDSVANTLSYAVLLCRSEQGEHDERVERLVEQALKALRSEVIVPVTNRIDDTDAQSMGALSKASMPDTSRDDDRSRTGEVRAVLKEVSDRLAALGFTGEAMLIDRGGCPTRQWGRLVCTIVGELGSNIAKHAVPGDYAMTVVIDADRTTIMSSNGCGDGSRVGKTCGEGVLSSGFGLRDLSNIVRNAGGTAEWCTEDGEWSIAIELPWAKVCPFV